MFVLFILVLFIVAHKFNGKIRRLRDSLGYQYQYLAERVGLLEKEVRQLNKPKDIAPQPIEDAQPAPPIIDQPRVDQPANPLSMFAMGEQRDFDPFVSQEGEPSKFETFLSGLLGVVSPCGMSM